MNSKVQPVFLISLVRSGSTLLQRLLMSHSQISSMAEPWFLLPLVYSGKKKGLVAEYDHSIAHGALEDLIKNLPNKSDDYYKFLGGFAKNIYGSISSKNAIYFLDKTPRYYLIIPEIVKMFPEAKFIFLFRNPIHIYSSILTTWNNNSFKNSQFLNFDLGFGPRLISSGYEMFKERAYALKYKELVNDPTKYLNEICNFLNIEYEEDMIKNFNLQDLKGRSVDPTGTYSYTNVSSSTLVKWKKVFNTKYRKKIITNYINDLDTKTLKIQGYSKKKLLEDIHSLDEKGSYSFIIDYYHINRDIILSRLSNLKNNLKLVYL